ncbi:alpha-amylase family glycosyl hydrolase [Parabacteroides bouchesdurhonensis]|uniref:alpha-amylase family glycosyl hydrolase n=1 Tax=Parabacteroides bouchesdurhonensis TaxID=1936995 RepID=UPI000E4F3CC2|nr:alpha-amylase family glycosyl hydrolase [Parabacteroides bouchesdurhonensis]RHJ93460.1 alpha-amylase [Bacteroides sp. AM07-16]
MNNAIREKEKMTIYQVFPRWFGNLKTTLVKNGDKTENGTGKFSDFTPGVLAKIKELGITHVWYTGVIEHATKTDYTAYGIRKDHSAVVKGKAGSPYAIKDYYDVDPDLADHVNERMAEFEDLVRRTHDAGMKVIMDFVPNHVARQYYSDARLSYVQDLGQQDNTSKAFDPNNNFYYMPGQALILHFGAKEEDFEYSEFPAKVTGNNCFSTSPGKNDWYETVKLNYGIDYMNGGSYHFDPRPDTWNKMLDILLFWAGKGIDGFRCDMAEMVPVEFWNWVISEVKKAHKDILFIAEVYNPDEYRNYIYTGHFDYLYDKVGLYDTVRAVMCGQSPASDISYCWQSLEGIQKNMLNFLENHDEQRIASDFFAGDPRPGIPGMIVSAAMNTNPVMIYSGQELGERGMDEEGFSGRDGRTTIFDYWSVSSLRNWINDWTFDGTKLTEDQKRLREMYARLLNIVRTEPVIVNGEFYDLMYVNKSNPYFNSHRQYAFMRKYENEVLLVVVNFDKIEQTVRIELPPEVFKALHIRDNKAAQLTDLLTGERSVSTLTDAFPYQVTIPACSGRMLKFTY